MEVKLVTFEQFMRDMDSRLSIMFCTHPSVPYILFRYAQEYIKNHAVVSTDYDYEMSYIKMLLRGRPVYSTENNEPIDNAVAFMGIVMEWAVQH